MLKSELRKIYLDKQKSLSEWQREEKSLRLAELFFRFFDLRRINFLHCFLPIEKFNEIDTKLILQKVWREFPHIATLVPRVNFQTSEIENLIFTPETFLKQNVWQIHEPLHDELIETGKIDLVVTPLLCFDPNGFRVGYGKGFYDKFLKNCRPDCLKIGLSYFEPVEEIADVESHDVRLDYCITPAQIRRFETEK